MIKAFARRTLAAASVGMILLLASGSTAQQAPGPTRTVLLRHDTTLPDHEAVLLRAEIPAGGREGRHTHPGLLLGYIEQGTLTLDYEGKPSAMYKAGESFFVEAGKVHEGINTGNVAVKVLATLVVKKGAALTTPAAAAR